MSRKGPIKPRKIDSDPVYNSQLLSKIINASMKAGKKSPAEKQVYLALKLIIKQQKLKEEKEVLSVIEEAIESIRPKVEVRPRRIGGAVYQVPRPVSTRRQLSLSIRWLINSARARPNKQYHSFGEKLSAEILSILKGEGSSLSKKTEVEKMAEANKAFSHLRW